ncbi:hypothetical protein AHAS_Ahas16G0115100 [Arachis hypogaea]
MTNGENRSSNRHLRSPLLMQSASRIHRESQLRFPPMHKREEKNVESLVKLLVDCILEAKENIDRNFAASLRNENMVTSTADVLTLMKLSEVNRAVSFAALNNRSSPSHRPNRRSSLGGKPGGSRGGHPNMNFLSKVTNPFCGTRPDMKGLYEMLNVISSTKLNKLEGIDPEKLFQDKSRS